MMRSPHRICFIVNKTAGAGRCAELFERAEAALRARNADFTVLSSEYAGHAVKLAEQALESGEKFIVAVGGDGTVNEVSSVLCGRRGITFGILPFGTGNDVARNLGLPLEPEKAADLLLDCAPRPLDMGFANGRKFINAAGFGFDVDVLINTEKHKKGRGGMVPYMLGIFDTIFNRKRVHAVIETREKRIEKDIIIAVVANGPRFGGGMKVAPEARMDDGLFDVCIIEYVGIVKFLLMLLLFVKGRHVGKKPVLYFKTDSLRISVAGPACPVQLDGEIVESTPVEFRIVPNALDIVRPAPGLGA